MEQLAVDVKDLLVNSWVKPALNRHRPGLEQDVFIFGTPRGGTTWLMEMVMSQPGFRSCNEPLDLRNPLVRKHLGISSWRQLYDDGSDAKLDAYFGKLTRGELYHLDPLPGRTPYYRYRTNRMVFKLIHGAEDRVGQLARRFDAASVLLLRHPIPVSLSRRQLPRLDSYLESAYRRHFDMGAMRMAQRIIGHGSELERAVLDWCLQVVPALRHLPEEGLVITYEQLVLEPEVVLPELQRALSLPDPEGRMFRHVGRPSKSSWQSEREAKELLRDEQGDASRRRLVERWRQRVGPSEEERLMGILDAFGLDVYVSGQVLPTRHWLGEPVAAA